MLKSVGRTGGLFAAGIAMALAMSAAAGPAVAQEDVKLPSTMIWTAYDVGSAGYVEVSGAADAIDRKFGSKVRIMPSGTSIGRLLPLKTGKASYGWLGNELNFASEGIFEFSAREWGPQDLRTLLGRPATVGTVAGLDTDIESPADLKGKKIAYVQANPSTRMNFEAVLAFGGLAPDDIEQVVYPSYNAALTAFIEGQVDAITAVPTSSLLRQAESGRGVRWLQLPAADTEGWDRVRKFASFYAPATETVGVSISEDKPVEIIGYRYPMISVYADADEEEVYNMVKAIDLSYDLFKDVNKVMPRWKVSLAGKTPSNAPYHPGAVRYLKEVGVWTDEDEAWNQARLERMKNVQAAWDAAVEKADAEKVSGADWPAFWEAYRTENLK